MELARTLKMAGVAAASVAAMSLAAAPASAQTTSYTATLDALNGSGTTGMAMVEVVDDDTVTVTVNTSSASPGQPHAQHIHIGGENVCPTSTADSNGDGLISTPEGKPAYGGIEVSLTTEGDVGEKSALAVERFPVASDDGTITYQRTFDLPEGTTVEELSRGVVVQHGIADTKLGSDPSAYDGPDSPLKAGVPQEATLPAACGPLSAAPAGGVQTGGGGTADDGGFDVGAYALAGLLAVGGFAAYRRTRADDA